MLHVHQAFPGQIGTSLRLSHAGLCENADLCCYMLNILCMVPKERPLVLSICVDVHEGKGQACRRRWVTLDPLHVTKNTNFGEANHEP